MKNNKIEKLESVIKQMLTPLKSVPFYLVMESLSGQTIVPFNSKDTKDKSVLNNLSKTAEIVGNEVNKRGILRPRPNEVGNDIELFLKNALNSLGYKSNTPKTKRGKNKTTGYPDLEFTDEFGRLNYLECKTFNINNIKTSQRSFYLSPSDDFKISVEAHHFVISFEVFVEGQNKGNNIYKCRSWKILSIENLEVDVKYEFNSDNARLYADEMILAEGNL